MDTKNMKPQYVGDDKISVRLAGLAWVSKYDKTYTIEGKTHYNLEFQYKGMLKVVEYVNSDDRDIMYNLVTEYLNIVKIG